MTENAPSFKSFNQPPLPPMLAKLLAGHELFCNLDAHDLREMSKFTELPNIEGLAAHAVERAAPPDLNPETRPGPAELPAPVTEALGRELARHPSIMVTGMLGGGCARPVRVVAIVPQTHAHLAQALRRMLWPADGAPPDFFLFIRPDALRRKDGSVVEASLAAAWPDEKTGVLIGYDDPALPARMLADAARRIWGDEPTQAQELWANPLIPAQELAQRADLRAAARAIGALPLGMAVDDEGRFPLLHGTEDEIQARLEYEEIVSGWVIVPRGALPAR